MTTTLIASDTPRSPDGLRLSTVDDLARFSELMAATGMYGTPAVCMVKILAGRELGFGAVASLTDVHVFDGKLMLGANLCASMIKRSPKYDYKVHERSDTACEVEFFERVEGKKESLGRLRYTLHDATEKFWHLTQHGKPKLPWMKTPANMLFARVMTDGKKTYCPDVGGGLATYDSDEFDVGESLVTVPNGVQQDEQQPDYRAQAQATVADATVQPPAGPTPATINQEQRAALVALIQERKRTTEEVSAMLASAGVKVLDHLPQSAVNWAASILIDGQAEPDQTDRITKLIEGRFSWEAIASKLQQRYGVDRLRLLTRVQADEVEGLLAPKPQPVPA